MNTTGTFVSATRTCAIRACATRASKVFAAATVATAAFFAIAGECAAQASAIAVRELSPVQSVSAQPFGLILQIHAFPDGRVLVNDGGARRLLVLNKSLAVESVLLDSLSGEANFYGPRASPIIHYTGDSALFVDGPSLTLLVVAPDGKIARTISPPKPTDIRWMATSAAGVDARGNLLYRGGPPRAGVKPGVPITRAELLARDSIPIVRAGFESRVVDTVASLVLTTDRRLDSRTVNGKSETIVFHNPLLVYDEWAVTSDGNVAIVRGSTYQLEIFDQNNKQLVSAQIPFDWRAISDKEKQHILDSARAVLDSAAARAAAAGSRTVETNGVSGRGLTLRSPSSVPPSTHLWVTPDEMPSYWPSIRQGAVTADLDGNVWILPATSNAASSGMLVYDVLNNKGALVYRVRLPAGRVVAGFGRGGVIYTSVKQATGGWTLERRTVQQTLK
ncbi:MAG: hypothetical protein ABJB74_06450 [Gemmatimonas sp.]